MGPDGMHKVSDRAHFQPDEFHGTRMMACTRQLLLNFDGHITTQPYRLPDQAPATPPTTASCFSTHESCEHTVPQAPPLTDLKQAQQLAPLTKQANECAFRDRSGVDEVQCAIQRTPEA